MKKALFTFAILMFALWPNLPLQAQCNPDVTPPDAECLGGTITLIASSQGTSNPVWARDFDKGSTDNCTSLDQLMFAFDKAGSIMNKTFALGSHDIVIYVFDEAGNLDSCSTDIEVVCRTALACNDGVLVNALPGDSAIVHIDDCIEGGPYCAEAVFSFSDTDPNDTTMTVYGDAGLFTPYTVYDLTTSNSCWGNIINCEKALPVAIADSRSIVSVNPAGGTAVSAEEFDEGSYSLCETIDFAVRRLSHIGACGDTSNNPRSEILFCCEDVGDTILVELIVTDDRGRENSVITEVIVVNKSGSSCDWGWVSGLVYKDDNDNCIPETGEDSVERVLVVVTDGTDEYVTYSEADGSYLIFAPHGTYDIYAQGPGYYWDVCPGFETITLDSTNNALTEDFGLTEATACPLMEVDVVMPRLRRCFTNYGSIHYYNTGTVTANDAHIIVELDDHISITDSDHPYLAQGGGSYRFDLGDVPSLTSGRISIEVYVDCDSTELGETKCVEAFIYPDTICAQLLTWSGANVEVEAECVGDSVHFKLKNTGAVAMDVEREYHVIEDDVIMFMRSFKLDGQEEMSISLLADGATLRLNAEQEINHPYPFTQSVAIEGCDDNGDFHPEFMRMFPMGYQEPFNDIECLELTGSYDPNEKAASPEGYGVPNYLEPGNPITYTLYFQNTGTDTAFNVFILDTISEHLDMTTFEGGASSHPVDINFLEGRAIRFDFPNIMLPDSFVNEPASNGFVQFTITPKADLPLPTQIDNKVGIYFDFNDPVITNTVTHTIDTAFLDISTSVDWWTPELEVVEVTPNPSRDWVTWKWSDEKQVEGSIEVLDLLGKTILEKVVDGSHVRLNLSGLHRGYYLFRINNGDQLFATGKIILE